MGAWIAINQFKFYRTQIKGLVGIGSAPEFLEKLMWKKFSKKTKKELVEKKISIIKNSQYEYPITLQLIKDGKKNKILNKRIKSQIKVTMIHGKKDDVVPVSFSKKVLSIFTKAKKKLVLVRNGNHSLSDNKSLKKILEELDKIVFNII